MKPGRLKQITANGKPVKAVNIHIFMEGEEGIFRLTTPEESPELHFDEVQFVVETFERKMKILGKFKTASQEKSFFVYDFLMEDYREFFV
ncbi:MAG: hypothetical protein LBS36_00715 [Oscillospiraceae bacterium]|nr:hypothetical protein [Oscillospiraceae bacterium]